MSRKITAFRVANIAPQPTCNYVVYIPSIITSPFAVEKTTLPFGEIESKNITIHGIQYSIPVKKKTQGTWNCTLNESILLTSIHQSLLKQHVEVSTDDILNKLYTVDFKNIYIYVTDGISGSIPTFACVLKDCYLEKMSPLSLDAAGGNTPMKIELTFRYNGISNSVDEIEKMFGTIGSVAGAALEMEGIVMAKTTAAWALNNPNNTMEKVTDLFNNLK